MTKKKGKTALVLVDVQNDFCPFEGSMLPVKEGDQVVKLLNDLQKKWPLVVATRDWHPKKTKHFKEFGGIWPPHCVQGTWGAKFHPDLNTENAVVFSKGMDPEDDGGYSGFDGVSDTGTSLEGYLRLQGVDSLLVGGLATDYCVKATVLDGLKLGFKVMVAYHTIRAVNLKPDDGEKAIKEMMEAGAIMIAPEGMETPF